MGLCLGPEVPNWALIRLRGENKTEVTGLELKGQYVYSDALWEQLTCLNCTGVNRGDPGALSGLFSLHFNNCDIT